MTFDDVDLLTNIPGAMERFCSLMEERATVTGIAVEIEKISERNRIYLAQAREFAPGRTKAVAKRCEGKKHPYLEMGARFVGVERGRRLGREAAKRTILTARRFAEVHTAISLAKYGDGAT